MKQISIFIFSLFISISIFGQGLKDYSDIIDIDDEYEAVNSNLNELRTRDLSGFWINNDSERRFGFIGNNYRRLRIKFLSIIKNPNDSLEYFVYGKSMVSDNICEFQGVIKIKESFYIKSLEYPNGNNGILAGEYSFFENPNSTHSGIFKGLFTTYWYKDEKGNIKYNDLWNVSAMYNNNQFAGIWTEYGKDKVLKANWGDSRIPLSGDLDVGTSEFCPAEKYASNGWIVFMIANGASPDRMNIVDARKSENREWWKEK
jgi:hypothetical protein